MTKLLAMGQFEAMIRYDAELRHDVLFDVFHHPKTDNDALAVVYIEINADGATAYRLTRLHVTAIDFDYVLLNEVVCELLDVHGKDFSDGLLALTARSVRFTADFAELMNKNPLAAIQAVISDPMGYDHEYQSFVRPDAEKKGLGLTLNSIGDWLLNNNAHTRSYIHFTMAGERFVVLGRQFREESFLMLSSYNPARQVAYFDGMITGVPIHQRVALDPKAFKGDRFFIDHLQDIPTHERYGHMWRLRHFGVAHTEDGELFIRGAHIAGRGPQNIPDAEYHDFSENRIIVI